MQEVEPKIHINPDVVVKKEDGLLFNPNNSNIMFINTTGFFIWERCLSGGIRDEIIADIVDRYDVIDIGVVNRDINNFLMQLERGGFVSSKEIEKTIVTSIGPMPSSICLGITNMCNLQCKHCLAGNTLNKDDELSLPEILGLIDELGRSRCRIVVSLFGGEPLMRRDFFDIANAFSRYDNLSLSLNTNGVLITKDVVKKLRRTKIRGVAVSLDGACKEIHNAFRGRESFDRVINGMRLLLENGFNVMLSCIVTRFNYKDLINVCVLGKKIGVSIVRFNEVVFIGNARCFCDELVLGHKEKWEVVEDMRKLREDFGDFVTGSCVQLVDVTDGLKKRRETQATPIISYPCGAGIIQCAIRSDGVVVPCAIIWDINAGNIKNQSFTDIWRNSPVLNQYRKPIILTKSDIPECDGCLYLRLCYKGHRCTPYGITGDYETKKKLICWRE